MASDGHRRRTPVMFGAADISPGLPGLGGPAQDAAAAQPGDAAGPAPAREWNSSGPAAAKKKKDQKIKKTFHKLISRSKVNPLLGFKGLDAFEYSPQYTYAVVRTHIGAFFTVLCTILLLAFIGYTLNDFVRGNVAKTTSSLSTTPDMQIVLGDKANLALAVETDRDVNAYDPTLLSISFRETTQSGPVSSNRARTNRPLGLLTNCSVQDRPDANPYYLCPSLLDGNCQGQFKDLTYRYIRVQVALCSGTGCKPMNVTKPAVIALKYTIWLYYEDYDAETRQPVLHAFNRRYFVVDNVAHSLDLLVAPRRVQISPRAYFDGSDTMYNLSVVQETTMTAQSSTWVPGAAILTFFVRVSDVYLRDAYTPYSFPQMFGDWGALWTAVSLSLGALGLWYNQWTFERAVKKHLGKTVDIRSLVALDLKLADFASIHVDKMGNHQTQEQIKIKLANLRRTLAAEVQDERSTKFDHSKSMQDLAYLVANRRKSGAPVGNRRRGSVFNTPDFAAGHAGKGSHSMATNGTSLIADPFAPAAGLPKKDHFPTGYSTPEEPEEPPVRARRRWKKFAALARGDLEGGGAASYAVAEVPRGGTNWLQRGGRPDAGMVFASPEEKLSGIEALVLWPSPPLGDERRPPGRGGSRSSGGSSSARLAPPVRHRGGGTGEPLRPPASAALQEENSAWRRLLNIVRATNAASGAGAAAAGGAAAGGAAAAAGAGAEASGSAAGTPTGSGRQKQITIRVI